MNVVVARAGLRDLIDVLPLVRDYRVFYKRPPDADAERSQIAENLAKHRSVIFVARNGSRCVGFEQLFVVPSTVRLGPAVILEDLYVDSSSRRQGIGRLLLDRATEYAREIGARGMSLETAVTNAAAQALYERAGWTRENEFYKYNAPPLT